MPPFATGSDEGCFTLRARVAEVLTGSRYALDLAGRRSLVELDDAAAPRPDQEFGREAAEYARERLQGKTVTFYVARIEGDHAQARVELDTGANLGLEMVRAGLAWAAPDCKDPLCRAAMESSRVARAGLWAGKNPIPPWEGKDQKEQPGATRQNPVEQFQGLVILVVLVFMAWYFFRVSRQVRSRLDAKTPPAHPPAPGGEKPLTRLAKAYFRKKFGRKRHSSQEES